MKIYGKFYNRRRKKIRGRGVISGSKNASLPIIAASILSGKKTTLYNVPKFMTHKLL